MKNLTRVLLTNLFILLLLSLFLNIYLFLENREFRQSIQEEKIENQKVKINNNYFIENISKKDYSKVKYKLKEEWKTIIKNIRNLHSSPVLIAPKFQDKELCAGYIWNLNEKLWWKESNYSIGTMNLKTKKPAKAWELPYFYEAFWWKVLINFTKKFSLKDKNYIEKISVEDMKKFFSKAFSEASLFWDIWFLYKNTHYAHKISSWNYNSHITKNMWISDFEFTFNKFDETKSDTDNFLENLSYNSDFKKYINLLENYKFYLNNKEIIFYNWDFYFLDKWNLWKKVKFKYLDKITYKDITLAHFFDGKSRISSLLQMAFNWEFFPINIIQINSRMIEKM